MLCWRPPARDSATMNSIRLQELYIFLTLNPMYLIKPKKIPTSFSRNVLEIVLESPLALLRKVAHKQSMGFPGGLLGHCLLKLKKKKK